MASLKHVELKKAQALEDQAEGIAKIFKKLETIEKKLDSVIVPQESSKAKGKAEAETKK
jgi:hypothetical protein